MPSVSNPILPGFNPDPSIVRVGEDYFIATSTFEWFPGVQIHHSRDLANWTLISRPLRRKPQLDMRGAPDSCGVWAPCLTFDGGKFWLVYTDVKRKDGSFKDTPNYIVCSEPLDTISSSDGKSPAVIAVEKQWSDPVYINSTGFDPSLFHDPDSGKKYFITMLQDHRRRKRYFAGIIVQEYDAAAQKLVGPRRNVFRGTELDFPEGPHMYKRDGWYYLLTAEGGTAYGHAVTFARSRDVWGPFDDDVHPANPMLTTRDAPDSVLQRAGHGDLVDTQDGRTFMVFLAGRPVLTEDGKRRCVLGRETCLQEVEWRADGWPYLAKGSHNPSVDVDVFAPRDEAQYWAEVEYKFNKKDDLPIDFQWLRTPEPERIFSVEDGHLRLIGRESIGSWYEQALVARRQTHFSYDAETVIDFSPVDDRQFAGLTAYYCRFNFFYLAVSGDMDTGNRELIIMQSEDSYPQGNIVAPMLDPVIIPKEGRVRLKVEVRSGKTLQFFYALEREGEWEEWKTIGPMYDASILSDECGGHRISGSFTGAFVGMACSDLHGSAAEAKFEGFVYRPVKES